MSTDMLMLTVMEELEDWEVVVSSRGYSSERMTRLSESSLLVFVVFGVGN